MAIRDKPFISNLPNQRIVEAEKYQYNQVDRREFPDTYWIYSLVFAGEVENEGIPTTDAYKRKIKVAPAGSITFLLALADFVKQPIIPASPDSQGAVIETGDSIDKLIFGRTSISIKTNIKFDPNDNRMYIIADKNILVDSELDPNNPDFGTIQEETNLYAITNFGIEPLKPSGEFNHTIITMQKINRYLPDLDLDIVFKSISTAPINVKKVRYYFEGNTAYLTDRYTDALSNRADPISIKIMTFVKDEDDKLIEDTSFNEPLKLFTISTGTGFETEHSDVGEYDFGIDSVLITTFADDGGGRVSGKAVKTTSGSSGVIDSPDFNIGGWHSMMPNGEYILITKGTTWPFEDNAINSNVHAAMLDHTFSDALSITSGTYLGGALYNNYPDPVSASAAAFPPYTSDIKRFKSAQHFYKKDSAYVDAPNVGFGLSSELIQAKPKLNIPFDDQIRKDVMLSIARGIPIFLGHNYYSTFPDDIETMDLPSLDTGGYSGFGGPIYLALLSVRSGVVELSKEVQKEGSRGTTIRVDSGGGGNRTTWNIPSTANYFINRLRSSWYDKEIGKVAIDTSKGKIIKISGDPFIIEIEFENPITDQGAISELFALTKNTIWKEFLDENGEWPKNNSGTSLFQSSMNKINKKYTNKEKAHKILVKYYTEKKDWIMVSHLNQAFEPTVFPIQKSSNAEKGQPLKQVYRDQWT